MKHGLKERITKSGQRKKFDFYLSRHKNDGTWNDIKFLIALDEKILDE